MSTANISVSIRWSESRSGFAAAQTGFSSLASAGGRVWRAVSLLANCAERQGSAFHEVLFRVFCSSTATRRAGPGPEPFVWRVEHACPSRCHHVHGLSVSFVCKIKCQLEGLCQKGHFPGGWSAFPTKINGKLALCTIRPFWTCRIFPYQIVTASQLRNESRCKNKALLCSNLLAQIFILVAWAF